MTTAADPSPRPAAARLLLFADILLFAFTAVWLVSLWQPLLVVHAVWAEALFPVLVLAATLLGLARTLPTQNVLAVAALIAVLYGLVDIINIKTSIPFGARVYTDALGPKFFGLVPWPLPFAWAAAILNSRGVARLILRPWRKTTKYGLWVIGLACGLTVVFDFNLEPFASIANPWWLWLMPKSVPAWQSAPWINFLACAVITLLILAFTTPWLINKQRPRSSPPDYHPLVLWLLLNLLFAVGDTARHLWLPAVLAVVLAAIVTTFALRNASW
jgi:uncharacterized membrane protein